MCYIDIEFILKFTEDDKIILPVIPESYDISKGNDNQKLNLSEIGEINLIGNRRLDTISISSFFPATRYNFIKVINLLKPFDYVDKIESWRKEKKPLRLIITNTNINIAVAIESFSFGESDGSGDVNFTLDLAEYRTLTIPNNTEQSAEPELERETIEVEAEENKTYTVTSGDNLWNIAKVFYGDGAMYNKIYEANKASIDNKNQGKAVDEYTIYSEQELVIPV